MPRPVPPDMMRVRLRATLRETATPVEEAQFGFYGQRHHYLGNTTDWPADVQEVAEGVRDRWNEHLTYKAAWTDAVAMAEVKVDHLNAADGKTLDQGVALFTGDDSWVGSSSISLPWETSLCVSLFAYEKGVFAADKGRKRGRFYLPPFATGVLDDRGGEVSNSALTNINEQIGAFLNDVQGMHIGSASGAGDTDYFNLVIMSIGTPLKPLDPTTYPVIEQYVDSKMDSQRRRERQQPPRLTLNTAIPHS